MVPVVIKTIRMAQHMIIFITVTEILLGHSAVPQGSVFIAFCCPRLSCHSRGIVRACRDLCCNLHSFLIKQWSVCRIKLASKEVTSRTDGILWLKRSPWHNVLIHTYPFFVCCTIFSSVTLFLFPFFHSSPHLLVPLVCIPISLSRFSQYFVFLESLLFINYVSLMKDTASVLKGMLPLLMSCGNTCQPLFALPLSIGIHLFIHEHIKKLDNNELR